MRSPSPTAVLFLLVLVLVPAAAQRRLLPPSPPRPFDPLRSPFGDPSRICPSVAGQAVRVGSFPSSPFVWHPFSVQFAKPQEAVPLSSYARPGDGHAIVAYKLDVYPIAVNLTCPKPTLFLSYGGTVPAPTIRVTAGTETLVRFTNLLDPSNYMVPNITDFHPCNEEDAATPDGTPRRGHPIGTHLHGSDSVAPFDGFAQDVLCFNESKDYVYPNNKDATAWFHDHTLDITTDHVYKGLAGFYLIEPKCGHPWNIGNLPEWPMMFGDKVLNSECQLLYDRENGGPHEDNLYGDINTVNGVPWPVLTMDATWHHFRWLNAGPSRPYTLKIVDAFGQDVSSKACQIVGGDVGYRAAPAKYPGTGLFMGAGERYQVVCDLRGFAGQTLYLFNDRDSITNVQKDVPFFCYSHIIAKLEVSACSGTSAGGVCQTAAPEFQPAKLPQPVPLLDKVISPEIKQRAKEMIAARKYTREFVFGRSNGHWTINNEDWFTQRIAAKDIGQNTWELWHIETGGGWFHPIHIHLVSFYIVGRNGDPNQVPLHERELPKDVAELHPSSSVEMLIRFGPHKGEYMFHCHNAVHEDHVMMRSVEVVNATLGRNPDTELDDKDVITANNVIYDRYARPLATDTLAKPSQLVRAIDVQFLKTVMQQNYHGLFYPTGADGEDVRLMNATLNPWLVPLQCPPTTSS